MYLCIFIRIFRLIDINVCILVGSCWYMCVCACVRVCVCVCVCAGVNKYVYDL